MPAESTRLLTAPKLVQDAARLTWLHRDDLLRLGAVPTLGTFGLNLVGLYAGGGLMVDAEHRAASPVLLQIALGAGGMLLGTLFSVAWLRALLRPDERAGRGLELAWTSRHWSFLGRSLVLALGCSLSIGAFAMVALAIETGRRPGAMTPLGTFALVVGVLAAAYLFFRLWLVLAAAAVDHRYSFARSRYDTAAVHVPMTLGMLLLLVVLTLAGLGFLALAGGLYHSAPLSVLLLNNALNCVFGAVLLAALAIVFRHCACWPGPDAARGRPAAGDA